MSSPPWWTLAQMLVWILQPVVLPPQDAAQYCDELTPKTIEGALNALTRALFDAIYGAVEGMPIVAARIWRGSRYEDLATLFQPLPSLEPGASDSLMYALRQLIRQPDVEFNPVWGKRTWPARVSAAPTQPTESAEPISAAEPGSEKSQPPNKSDSVDTSTPAGPARIINVDYDPAIRHALAHALERAKPAPSALEPTASKKPPVEKTGAQALESSKRDLQSYGVDLSAGRYAALDRASRVAAVAAAAARMPPSEPAPAPAGAANPSQPPQAAARAQNAPEQQKTPPPPPVQIKSAGTPPAKPRQAHPR